MSEINFLYGQAVTADNLNEIAIDLGAESFSEFADSVPYAVEKLNSITADLVGKGITNALNRMQLEVTAEGVTVNTGVAIFTSGRKIKLNEPVTLSFSAGELFIEENETLNTVSIKIGELPELNDYIHLATVSEDGTFADKRPFAVGKTAPLQKNLTESFSVSKTYTVTEEGFCLVDSIPLTYSGYNGFIISTSGTPGNYVVRKGFCFFDGNEASALWLSWGGSMFFDNNFIISTGSAGANQRRLKFKINGNVLDVYMDCPHSDLPCNEAVNYDITMF